MITETRTCACGSVMRPVGMNGLVICVNCDVPQAQEFDPNGPGRIKDDPRSSLQHRVGAPHAQLLPRLMTNPLLYLGCAAIGFHEWDYYRDWKGRDARECTWCGKVER